MTDPVTAERDQSLEARVVSSLPLRYAEGPDESLDRPAHVRAGSGLAWVPGGIALVQDDANFVAVFDPATARVRSITLPVAVEGRRQFDDGRGNKAHKLDLEACVAIDDGGETLLVAFGSGSTPRREHVLLVDGWTRDDPAPRVIERPALYAALRAERRFSGTEMNVEGAAVVGERVRLFARGNGAPRDGERPVNATCDLDLAALLAHLHDPDGAPPPHPTAVVRYDLGALDGIPLGFTDATPWGDGMLFSAAAEDSPDAVRDGRVAGSVIGLVDAAGRARWTPLVDARGRPFEGKVEGVAPAEDGRLWVVVDADAPDRPSELCAVELVGA